MGRARRPKGLIMCRKRRRTAIYKRMPTMYKKAMELNENCGVDVTLVTENEGVYRFYNTGNRDMREVFEGYLLVLQNSPQCFNKEKPAQNQQQDNTQVVPALDVCEPESLSQLFDAAVDVQKSKDSAKRKAARKAARAVARQKLADAVPQTMPPVVPQTSSHVALQSLQKPLQGAQKPLQSAQKPLNSVQRPLNSVQKPLHSVQKPLHSVSKTVAVSPVLPLVAVKAIRKEPDAALVRAAFKPPATTTTKPLSATTPLVSFKLPERGTVLTGLCVDENRKALTVDKTPKKRKTHLESPMPGVGVQISAILETNKMPLVKTQANESIRHTGTGDAGIVSPNPKRQKKQTPENKVPAHGIADTRTVSARVAAPATFVDEDEICRWLNGVEEMSKTINDMSSGSAMGQSDPIFARFARS